MQDAGTVLEVLRERGREGLLCDELYRQMFNKSLYLLAYGNIYSNQGAMTPGAGDETADGMSEAKIDQIVALMRAERYRFAPVRRVLIPKKNGKLRRSAVSTRKSCERACRQPTWRFAVATPVAALPVRGLPVGRGLCPGSEVFGAGVPGQEPFQRRPGQGLPAVAPAFVEVGGEVGQLVEAGHPGRWR